MQSDFLRTGCANYGVFTILDELSEGTTFEEKMTLSEYILKGFKELGASTLLVTHNHEL